MLSARNWKGSELADGPAAILIAGPTASGKSAAAVELARRLGGAVVNADSMQVYSVLRVLTARPDEHDLAAAEHLLFGHAPPSATYSVAAWLRDVGPVLASLREQGRPAIVTGGTGLYFMALEQGLSQMPAPDPAVRARWREFAAASPERLHAELALRDPQGAARLAASDTQRLVRALEMFDTTGEPLASHQATGERRGLLQGYRVFRFVLEPARAVLHERINARFDAMMASGAIAEVEALLSLGLDPSMPAMKAIGVPQIAAFLDGSLTREEASERSKAASRQYAKRQSTWFRGQFGPEWRRIEKSADLSDFRMR